MFTGLIEEVGKIEKIELSDNGAIIFVSAKAVFDDLKIGDSIAINGVCQTVTEIKHNIFSVVSTIETLSHTNFKNLTKNDEVNLERAIMLKERLGGHIVSGHTEGVGEVIKIVSEGNSTRFSFKTSEKIMRYIIHKGSVTINGVSLTVCNVENTSFDVSVIPHTLQHTTFKNLKQNDKVNLETDIIAKYVENFMIKNNNTNNCITEEFLREHGF